MGFGQKSFKLKSLVVAFMALAITACNKTEKVIERQAPSNVQQSFTSSQCEQSVCLKIKKESLSKVFMMISSGKGGGVTPQWFDFKPQLVSFDRVGDKIALFEENYRSVYEEIKNRELLQTFQILGEDSEAVTFKWGQGLETLVYESPIDLVGPKGMEELEDEEEQGIQREYLNVVDSVTLFAKVSPTLMEVHQVSKVRNFDPKKGFSEETLGMNIQFYPYVPNEAFQRRNPDNNRHVGFFVTKTGVKNFSNQEEAFINRWDVTKPIQVLVSSAVPKEFENAVKEGALYWNKVIGKEVIQVQLGVDPAVEPQQRSIIVRWIPWLDSGAAYATHQTDPITGEILRAQVFMPSVFTRVGSADLLTMNGDHPVLKGQGLVACDLSSKIQNLHALSQEADSSKRLQLARDGVRSTVAHEVGHALGMRHNFAGSFSAKVSTKTILKTAEEYFKTPNHPGLETSTSIMDYAAGIDDILLSARLKNAPLSYDKMAMDFAVQGTKPNPEISLFCTDEDISIAKQQKFEIYGCQRFDSGNNPLYRKLLDAEDEKNKLIKVLFTSIIGRKFPSDQSQPAKATEQILEETKQWMQLNVSSLEYVNQALYDHKRDSKVQSRFVSLEKYLEKPFALTKGDDIYLGTKLKRDLQELGGLSRVYGSLLLNQEKQVDLTWYQDQLEDLISQNYFSEGTTLGGRPYILTPDDQSQIVKFFMQFAELNQFSLLIGFNKYLVPKTETLEDGFADLVLKASLSDMYDVNIRQVAQAWIFATVGSEKGTVGASQEAIEVPQYLLSGEERFYTKNLLDGKFMGPKAVEAQSLLVEELASEMLSVINKALPQPSQDKTANGLEDAIFIIKQDKLASDNVIKWLESDLATLRRLMPKQAPGNLSGQL
ncbi:MAG: zinc-dependent metalloprotease [Bdellovibrionia bacterium]